MPEKGKDSDTEPRENRPVVGLALGSNELEIGRGRGLKVVAAANRTVMIAA